MSDVQFYGELKKMCYKIILNCTEELVPFYEKNSFKKSAIQMNMKI